MPKSRALIRRSENAPPQAAGDAGGTRQRVTMLVVPRFNMAAMLNLIEPLRVANYLASRPLYDWDIVSFDGPEVVASNGLAMAAPRPEDRSRRGETVFVVASWGGEDYANRETAAWLRRQARDGASVCPVELGCYIAAAAGLLAGRPVATHWSWAPGFGERYPDIRLVEQIFTSDEAGLTCAGGTAGLDMMLHVIAARHGRDFAGEVADQLLHHPARPAGAPQRRMMARGAEGFAPAVRQAVSLIERQISEPLPVPEIAASVGISQRQLEREFKVSLGCTVVQFGLLVRLQHARVLLIATRLSVREIAAACGFNTLSHFVFSFRRCFGRRPGEYRQAWPHGQAAPSWPGTLSDYVDSLARRPSGP